MDVTDIEAIMDDHGFTDLSSIQKMRFINNQYKRVCSLEPWPFMEQISAASTSSAFLSVPADWSKTVSFIMYSDVNNSNVVSVLSPMRIDEATKNLTNQTATGTPQYYWFQGDDFMYLYPAPSSTLYYRHTYVRKASDLTEATLEAAILLPARYHDILMYGALMDANAQNDDLEAATYFKAQRDQRVAEMQADVFAEQYDRPDYIQVIDPDDWGIDW